MRTVLLLLLSTTPPPATTSTTLYMYKLYGEQRACIWPEHQPTKPTIPKPASTILSNAYDNKYCICDSFNWFWTLFCCCCFCCGCYPPMNIVNFTYSFVSLGEPITHTRIKWITEINFVNEFKLSYVYNPSMHRLSSIPMPLSFLLVRSPISFCALLLYYSISIHILFHSYLFCLASVAV